MDPRNDQFLDFFVFPLRRSCY